MEDDNHFPILPLIVIWWVILFLPDKDFLFASKDLFLLMLGTGVLIAYASRLWPTK